MLLDQPVGSCYNHNMKHGVFGLRLAELARDVHRASACWLTWKDADPLLAEQLPALVRVHQHPCCRVAKADPDGLAACMDADAPDNHAGREPAALRCPHGLIELRAAIHDPVGLAGLLCLGAWRDGPTPTRCPPYEARRAMAVWRLIHPRIIDLLADRRLMADRRHPAAITDPLIAQALAIIDTEASARLRLGAVAARLGLSPSRFSHRFTAACGISFGRLVQQRLMQQAARRLVHSRLRIIDLALDLGYDSPDHFAALFRRHTGLSPARYRRQIHLEA